MYRTTTTDFCSKTLIWTYRIFVITRFYPLITFSLGRYICHPVTRSITPPPLCQLLQLRFKYKALECATICGACYRNISNVAPKREHSGQIPIDTNHRLINGNPHRTIHFSKLLAKNKPLLQARNINMVARTAQTTHLGGFHSFVWFSHSFGCFFYSAFPDMA